MKKEQKEILKNIKLIALDLDETTLTRAGLTKRTKRTLEEAINRGYEVVIATGRPLVAVPDKVRQIKGLRYVITSNGAHVVDNKTDEFLYSSYLDREVSLKMREFFMERSFPVELFTDGKAFVDRTLYDDLKENGSTYMGARYIVRTRKPVDGIYDFWLEHADRIENINSHYEKLEDKEAMREILSRMEGFTLTTSQIHNLEIGGVTTSKASGLKALCDILGIDLINVIAFGDSPNDSAMLKECGFGVAMGNALPEVKEIADHITLTNEEEGVCYAVRTLLFGEKNGVPQKIRRKAGRLYRKLLKGEKK